MIVPYTDQYFVDREDLLALVLDKVRVLLKDDPVRMRITAFYGPRGSGKSWLIRELHRRALSEFANRIEVLYLSFCDDDTNGDTDRLHIRPEDVVASPDSACQRILDWCCGQVELSPAPNLALDEQSGRLVGWCQAHRQCPLLVLVDGIDELFPSFLRPLESYFLAPLVIEPNALMVLGGRTREPRPGNGYVWKSPELKLYADEYTLKPFNERWTREQLTRLEGDYLVIPAAAPMVVEVGGGYPLSNVVLARYVRESPPDWEILPAGLEECAKALLESVDKGLRPYFWALCVLRAFDEDRMPPLLAVWFGDDVAKWDYQRCWRIREDMAATRLVSWQGARGYVMDEALHTVLKNALRVLEPERWRALHQAACNLYAEWVERYPKARDRWRPEVDYHQRYLQDPLQNSDE